MLAPTKRWSGKTSHKTENSPHPPKLQRASQVISSERLAYVPGDAYRILMSWIEGATSVKAVGLRRDLRLWRAGARFRELASG